MKIICALFLLGCFCHQILSEDDPNRPKRRFAVVKTKGNWYDAYVGCRLRNMHLVSIHTEAENNFVKSIIKPDGSGYWISALDVSMHLTNFVWIGTGEAVGSQSYTNWQEQPGGTDYGRTCGAMLSDGQWTFTNCSVYKQYVCEQRDSTCKPRPNPDVFYIDN